MSMKRILTIIASQWVFLLILLLLARIAFFIIYFDLFKDAPPASIVFSFIYGLRFDLSVIAFIYGLINLPLFLPIRIFQHKNYLRFTAFIGYFALIFIVSMVVSDLGYYAIIGRRMSFEFYGLGNDITAMISLLIKNETLPLIAGLLFLGLLSWLWWKMWNTLIRRNEQPVPFKWYIRLFAAPIALIVFVLIARGGFQLKPLMVSDAFVDSRLALGHLALNAPFTILRQSSQKILSPHYWVDQKAAKKTLSSMLTTDEQQTFINPDYPFFRERKSVQSNNTPPLNIVLLILESWPAHSIGSLGGKVEGTTPFFDSLSKKGILFNRFVANGTRSIEGLASTILSIPAFGDFAFMMGNFEQNIMRPFPAELSKRGYDTIFIHGNNRGSFGSHQFARKVGYKTVLAKEDFDNYEKLTDGTWGIWDHLQLERLYAELNKVKGPFFSTWFSSSSHEPFVVPGKEHEFFKEDTEDYAWLNTLRYSDWSLKHFFKMAEQAPWFKNTLFIITADHTISGRADKTWDSSRIPLLLYTPSGKLSPQIDSRSASQIDIVPTIIDVLDLNIQHSSMGRSLLSEAGESFGIFSSSTLTWFQGQFAYQFSGPKLLGMYDTAIDKDFRTPIPVQTKLHTRHIKNYKAFYQTARNTVILNRVAPAE